LDSAVHGSFSNDKRIALAVHAPLLAFIDAAGHHGGDAHAVAQEQDDVLGLAGAGMTARALARAAWPAW
jgi:hypothetical protein